MRNINILGMELKDCSARESLNRTERFLQEGAVRIILYLTGGVLLEAQKSEAQKAWIEEADLTLWADPESLQAAGVTAGNRYREVDGQEFLQGFLHKLGKQHRGVLVVADTQEQADDLKAELQQLDHNVTYVGSLPLNVTPENRESMINEINLIAPAVVIARMAFGAQLQWLTDSRALLNTKIWIAMPEKFSCMWKKESPWEKLLNRINNDIFKRRVNNYTK